MGKMSTQTPSPNDGKRRLREQHALQRAYAFSFILASSVTLQSSQS
jgi:hypothetical protein